MSNIESIKQKANVSTKKKVEAQIPVAVEDNPEDNKEKPEVKVETNTQE